MFSNAEETVDLRDWVESATAPASPEAGGKWLDTSADPHVLKRWNGTSGVVVAQDSDTTRGGVLVAIPVVGS